MVPQREKLEARKDFQEWYAFSAPRNLNVHDHAQMVVPLLANRGMYARLPPRARKYCLMASGGFSISVASGKFSANYILGLLNSRLLFWKLRQISSVFRGGWITCTKQYVGQLPIREINFENPSERAQHDRIVALVEQMLQLQKDHAEADILREDKRLRLKDRIEELDEEIDQAVFELYGLTEEEIKIVKEGETGGG